MEPDQLRKKEWNWLGHMWWLHWQISATVERQQKHRALSRVHTSRRPLNRLFAVCDCDPKIIPPVGHPRSFPIPSLNIWHHSFLSLRADRQTESQMPLNALLLRHMSQTTCLHPALPHPSSSSCTWNLCPHLYRDLVSRRSSFITDADHWDRNGTSQGSPAVKRGQWPH